MPCDDTEWIKRRLARTEELIEKIEDAIEALAGGAQHYHLDTGQTRQSVTKAQLASLRSQLASLEQRRADLRARLCRRAGRAYIRPGF